jgi:hypothetical protein
MANLTKAQHASREWRKKNKEHHKALIAKWEKNNRLKYLLGRRNRWNKKRYGITLDDYLTMCEKVQNCCEICGNTPNGRWKKLCIDHDHKTGKVRGLLCEKCNTAIGLLGDSAEKIQHAIIYLEKHERTP